MKEAAGKAVASVFVQAKQAQDSSREQALVRVRLRKINKPLDIKAGVGNLA